MQTKATMTMGNLKVTLDGEDVTVEHGLRSGNDTEHVKVGKGDFFSLLNMLQAVVTLHPEW